MDIALQGKIQKLETYIENLGSAVVAFSGGVDSTFLAAMVYRVLGSKGQAFTIDSPTSASGEVDDAKSYAKAIGITHHVLFVNELENPDFMANTKDRCYICKKNRFSALVNWAKKNKIAWVLDGSNLDDLGDYRPGMRALEELPMVKSPLLEVGFTKTEIRQAAKALNLLVWNKPSSPCLATRIPYDYELSESALEKIRQGEAFLKPLLEGSYRVRYHGKMVRLEVETQEFSKFTDSLFRMKVQKFFENLGFLYVSLDLKAFVSGNLNRQIIKKEKFHEVL